MRDCGKEKRSCSLLSVEWCARWVDQVCQLTRLLHTHTHTRRKGQLNYLQNMRKAFARNLSRILLRFSNHNWSGQLVLFSPCYGQDGQHTGEMRLSLPLLMMIRDGMTWHRPFLIPHQARPALLVGTTTTPPPSTWSILSSSSWILNVTLGYQSNL